MTKTQTDVLILGGGVGALTLSSQVKRADPDIDVVVVEKNKHPLPEATHKVGESTVPVAARYFRDILGIEDHLKEQQLPKMGLRFFATHGGNRDITQRPELGPPRFPVLRTYQIDRGRLENSLAERAQAAGVTFLDGARVTGVELGDPLHTVTVTTDADGERALSGRYLIDASGRAAILKRHLGLEEPAEHTCNAAWFRIADHIKVDDWSDDPDWQGRVASPDRWLSTVHLHGPGYWVWLIPLGSGSISVGVVADPDHVPFERIRRFESVLEWLHENEPQLAAEVEQRADLVQDFLTRKDYARKCSKVFSPERWFIVGDAGYFHDPLYSPGMDLISVANSFITELIADDRRGREDIEQQIATADVVFRAFAEDAFNLYEHQYPLLGSAELTSVKVTWEQLGYLGLPAVLAFGDQLVDDSFAFIPNVAAELGRNLVMNKAFHVFLRDWAELADDRDLRQIGMLSTTRMDAIQHDLNALESEADMIVLIKKNIDLLEEAFREIVRRVAAVLGVGLPEDEALLRADQRMGEFRLRDLPRGDAARHVPPPDSSCGLLWATETDPDGGLSPSWGAWPAARYARREAEREAQPATASSG